jgi:uncharacterized membrane protein
MTRTKTALAAAAAALFASGVVATVAQAQSQGTLKCVGGNACKGTSACKSANSACKGQNACKGTGFTMVGTDLECTVIKSK